jgi:AcrR family transcriptional regulator
MPRAGLTAEDVVSAAADIVDETGYDNLTMSLLAERLGIRSPSLYRHMDGLADLRHRIATLAITELGEATRDAMLGTAGPDALAAFARAFRSYVVAHPGRYTATIGAEFTGPEDPLFKASARLLDSIAAVLRGYGLAADEMDHALRAIRSTFHGFAALQAANGFQWSADLDESFEWMIHFVDRGLSR